MYFFLVEIYIVSVDRNIVGAVVIGPSHVILHTKFTLGNRSKKRLIGFVYQNG